MTLKQFCALCQEYNIIPELTLGNTNLVAALNTDNDEEVNRILKEEF